MKHSLTPPCPRNAVITISQFLIIFKNLFRPCILSSSGVSLPICQHLKQPSGLAQMSKQKPVFTKDIQWKDPVSFQSRFTFQLASVHGTPWADSQQQLPAVWSNPVLFGMPTSPLAPRFPSLTRMHFPLPLLWQPAGTMRIPPDFD